MCSRLKPAARSPLCCGARRTFPPVNTAGAVPPGLFSLVTRLDVVLHLDGTRRVDGVFLGIRPASTSSPWNITRLFWPAGSFETSRL